MAEEIDIDEKEDAEVFRVPAHNDVDGADFYHDFKNHLTVTRIPARKVCYISEMNPSLSPPAKLKADFDRAAVLRTQLPVALDSHLVAVTGPADRLVLTKEILDFCGALPIYNTEIIEGMLDSGNKTTTDKVDRQKRQAMVTNFVACSTQSVNIILSTCPTAKWELKCKMRLQTGYYVVRCKNMRPLLGGWKCAQRLISNSYPVCCDLACPC